MTDSAWPAKMKVLRCTVRRKPFYCRSEPKLSRRDIYEFSSAITKQRAKSSPDCRRNGQRFSYTDTEEAPLVPASHGGHHNGWGDTRNPLADPTAGHEIETTEQFVEQNKPKTSNFSTMMHLLKGNIGTGILAMPKAISNAGLLIGSLGIPILGIICVHCMHLLVKNSKALGRKIGRSSLDYSSTAETAFLNGPEKLKKLSPVARCAVNTMLMLTQFGFCCVYFLFVAKSIHEVVMNLTGSSAIGVKEYMAMILPVMIVFNFIRNLKKLSPASFLANILQISGLCMIFYYLFTDIPSIYTVPMTAPVAKLPLYFGTAMYAFEGIGVVLPLENAMETPADFAGPFGVLNTGMVIVTCLYTAVGFYGYLKYGDKVAASITFNLEKSAVSEAIRLMFAAAIFLSYALQLYVPLEILWPLLRRKFFLERYTSRQQLAIELVLRTLLVLFTFVLAAAIPLLDLFISLVGALASSSLALIFPPIIDIIANYDSSMSRKWRIAFIVKNVIIMILGIVGCILGTYVSVNEISICLGNRTACQT